MILIVLKCFFLKVGSCRGLQGSFNQKSSAMMTDSVRLSSSFGRQFSDERATMAGERELTLDIYNQSLLRISPRTDASTNDTPRSTAATGIDSHVTGLNSARTSNGAVLTGSARKKNGFLPSGMSRGSDRNDNNGKKLQLSRKLAPVWRRFAAKQDQEPTYDHRATYNSLQTPVNRANMSYDSQVPAVTSTNRTAPTRDGQNRPSLNVQSVIGGGSDTMAGVRRSSSVDTRSDSAQEQHHLHVILGAPAGFRDSSFDESAEASKTAADSNLRLQKISMNADGSMSQDLLSSFTDVKKRPAPPVPPVKLSLPPTPTPVIVQDFNAHKRLAPEAPSRVEQPTAPTSSDTIQSSATEQRTEIGDKPAANVKKIDIPNVFCQPKSQSGAPNVRSSPKSEGGSVSSIFRRTSFIRHLETVIGRNTPTSSAVSTMTGGTKRSGAADNSMHNYSSTPEEFLNQSTDSLVSRLFHSALRNHDNSGAKKKFKFPVPEIDVPAQSSQQHPAEVDADETAPKSRVRRGFSYLKGAEVAEVTRRAANVTARRQHESLEEARVHDIVDNHGGTDDEEAMIRAARARLHAPQPRYDLPSVTASSHSDGGNRKQMLLDVVAAAQKRARKNGMEATGDNYLQEDVKRNQNDSDRQTRNLVRDSVNLEERRLKQNTREPNSLLTLQPRDLKESKDMTDLGSRPEVPGGVSETTSGGLDSVQLSDRHEFKTTDYNFAPAAPKFSAAGADVRTEGFTSYRAARHAHSSGIDRPLHAAEDGLVVNDAIRTASVRNSSYLPHTSAAPGANRHADAGVESRYIPQLDLQRRYRDGGRPVSSSSSDDDLTWWWVDDDEDDGGGGYTVYITGGQVRARRWDDRLRRQRPAAKYRRRGSSLKRRPRVQERPVSVEIWSSGDEGETRRKDDHPRRQRFITDHRHLPLTVNTDNYTGRPQSVIGHIRNLGVTQSPETARRWMTGAESIGETLHYFSDPETKLSPYRTGAYVSQPLNSSSSLDFLTPEVDTLTSNGRTFFTVPLHASSLSIFQHQLEPVAAIDPHLADVGTKNRRYFVQMKLNAARGRKEVIGIGGDGSSNSGVSNGAGLTIKSLYGSAPQLFQLNDDVTDQYTGARQNAMGEQWSGANVGHATVYDVTSSADQGASLVVRRPQSTLSWTGGVDAATSRHVRSVTSAWSPPAAVRVDAAELRRPVRPINGDVNRPTVEFDIELEPTRLVEMDKVRRSTLLSSVHTNGLPTHRSVSPPRYAIQLNDTMHFDIDSGSDKQQRRQRAPNPPTYERIQYQRQQRRQRPSEQDSDLTTERHRAVVDLRPPGRPPRRRRQFPVVYEDSRSTSKANHISVDDELDDEDFETRLSAPTTEADRQPSTIDANDLPRVVRGSILIRNSIDTTGTPRHVDVVTADSDAASDATFVVEDNTNMFDGLYRQSRENPIYLSDPEQPSDEVDGTADNFRVLKSTRSQQIRRQNGRTKNRTFIVDDFNKNVRISRGA